MFFIKCAHEYLCYLNILERSSSWMEMHIKEGIHLNVFIEIPTYFIAS